MPVSAFPCKAIASSIEVTDFVADCSSCKRPDAYGSPSLPQANRPNEESNTTRPWRTTVTLSSGSFALRISASIASSRLPSIPCDSGEAVRQPAVGQYDGTGGAIASTLLGCSGGPCTPTGLTIARAPPAETTFRDPLDTPPTSTTPVVPTVIRPTTNS